MKLGFLATAALLVGCSDEPPATRHSLDQAKQPPECREPINFFQPSGGVINSDRIAKEVAFQYLHEVFPEDQLRPLSAKLEKGVWHVKGYFPANSTGGAAHILMCQSNGRVLKIYHEQ
jgi:hypothetical protein